ncbi:TPA: hypothetical protein ACSP1Y_001967, partial [Aeromonas hydrophila]
MPFKVYLNKQKQHTAQGQFPLHLISTTTYIPVVCAESRVPLLLDEQINDSFDAHQIHFDLYKLFYKHLKNNNL